MSGYVNVMASLIKTTARERREITQQQLAIIIIPDSRWQQMGACAKIAAKLRLLKSMISHIPVRHKHDNVASRQR